MSLSVIEGYDRILVRTFGNFFGLTSEGLSGTSSSLLLNLDSGDQVPGDGRQVRHLELAAALKVGLPGGHIKLENLAFRNRNP